MDWIGISIAIVISVCSFFVGVHLGFKMGSYRAIKILDEFFDEKGQPRR